MFSLRVLTLVSLAGLVAMLSLQSRPLLAADKEIASVEGKISLKGKPLPEGKVVFHPLDKGKPVVAHVVDGAYMAKDLPVGASRVVVEGKGVPAKYSSPDLTPLRAELKKGKNALDFRLE